MTLIYFFFCGLPRFVTWSFKLVRPFMARWLVRASGLAMGATSAATAGKWGRSQMKAGIPCREGIPVFHFKGQCDGRDQEYGILSWPMLGQCESSSSVPTTT